MLLALRPGQGLGPFQLGASLPQVLDFLQQHKGTNEGLGFRCVEVKYSEKDTLQRDIVVTFPEHGFQLHFEPGSQRLRLVEVFDTTRLQMVYGRTAVFGGASDAPTFERIYQAFGPTYPGEMDAEGISGFYPLQYPGIMVLFLMPSHQQQQQQQQGHGALPGMGGYGGDAGGRMAPSIPVPLAAVAERIYIHSGTRGLPTAVLASPPPPLEPGTHYMNPLDAVPGRGLFLGQGLSPAAVLFGDSTQDVVMHLGQPARVVPKAQGGPTAHNNSSHNPSCTPDYFYTYPSRGLDLLFCGGSHRLIKAVLHTNVPGHPDFAQYCKCNFRVHPAGWQQAQQEQPAHSMPEGGCWGDGLGGAGALGSVPPGAEELPGPAVAAERGAPPYGAASYGEPPSTGYSASSAGDPSMAKHDAAVGPDVSLLAAGSQHQQQLHQQGQEPQEQRSRGQVEREIREVQQHVQAGEQLERQVQGQQEEAQQAQQGQQEQEQDSSKPGGLTAAYQMLVGLIDDVMTLDPQKLSASAAAAAGDASATEASEGESPTAAGKAPTRGQATSASVPAGTGKPPKPPAAASAAAALPLPQPVCISKSSKKKKGKKARKAAVAAAAAGAQSAFADLEESDSMADASASDSGFDSSSLASSPGLTSHFMIPGRRRLGLASGYQSSDYGSTADLAGKEGSVGAGSHLDGWSDAEDLLQMVAAAQAAAEEGPAGGGGEGRSAQALEDKSAAGAAGGSSSVLAGTSTGFEVGDASLAGWAAPAPAPAAAPSALTAALGGSAVGGANGPCEAPGTSSAGVQTSDAAVGDDGSGFLACGGAPLADLDNEVGWEESDSPQGYVIPDKPDLFDEGCGPAEYERVPSQRDCSTQTPSHLLSPPPRGGAGAAGRVGPAPARGQQPAGNGTLGAAVTADSRLEDIESVFGHQGGPALHNRLGSSHPFGPSYLYAYRGVVFEVLQNGLIATVTLFRP